MRTVNIVFDTFPCPEGPRFIEVEDENGKSISAGQWRSRSDGLAELSFVDHRDLLSRALDRLGSVNDPEDDALYALRREIALVLAGPPSPTTLNP